MSNKAASTLGQVTESDLLAWADKQTLSGAFGVNPATTTQGVPVVGWYHGFLEVKASGRRITLTESAGQYCTWTNCTSSDEWTKWVRQTTATPPQEYDLPLADGFSPQFTHSCVYCKTQENIVVLNIALIGEIPAASDTTIGTLPLGFRPNSVIRSAASNHFSPYGVGSVSIDKTGIITVRFTETQSRCNFCIVFVAAN